MQLIWGNDLSASHERRMEKLAALFNWVRRRRKAKGYFYNRTVVLPVSASAGLLVLVWILFSNRRQELHLERVFAKARARQYFLAAADGADLGENFTVCLTQWGSADVAKGGKEDAATLHVVTPTYRRPEQMAELTRLAQTIDSDTGPLHWIVATDSKSCDREVEKLLLRKFPSSGGVGGGKRSLVLLTLLAAPMPSVFREPEMASTYALPRGVAGRRAAIRFILGHDSGEGDRRDVLYFADDDNAYDASIFGEVRRTRRVSMFPVGLLRPMGVSSPLLDKSGKVAGFAGQPNPRRAFPVDMAGFAVRLDRLRQAASKRRERKKGTKWADLGVAAATAMPYRATYEEEGFLTGIGVNYDEIEPLASNCTEILVWHTMTAAPAAVDIVRPGAAGEDSNFLNLPGLVDSLARAGMGRIVAPKEDGGGQGEKKMPVCVGREGCVGKWKVDEDKYFVVPV